MTVYVLAVANPAGALYATAGHHVDGKKALKKHCHMVRHNGHPRCRSVELVRYEDYLVWTAEPLRMRYAFCIDGKLVAPAQKIKLRKIRNVSTAIVRCETRFTDTIRSASSCAPVLEKIYVVSFVDNLFLSIFNDYVSSNFSAANSKAIYSCYIGFDNMMIKKKNFLPLHMTLVMNKPVLKRQCSRILDGSSLYISTEEDIILMIQAADEFMNNEHKLALCRLSAFYYHARALLMDYTFVTWSRVKRTSQHSCFSQTKIQ